MLAYSVNLTFSKQYSDNITKIVIKFPGYFLAYSVNLTFSKHYSDNQNCYKISWVYQLRGNLIDTAYFNNQDNVIPIELLDELTFYAP